VRCQGLRPEPGHNLTGTPGTRTTTAGCATSNPSRTRTEYAQTGHDARTTGSFMALIMHPL